MYEIVNWWLCLIRLMGFKLSININSYLNFLVGILSFVIIIDPPNTYLHLKDPFFLILLLSCIILKKPSFNYFIPVLLVLLIWLNSSIWGLATCEIKDFEFNMGILKALIPFLIMGWIKDLNFTKYLTLPCCIISIISITVSLAMLYSPTLEYMLYNYFTEENGLMMISNRSFVGISIPSAFYRSTPLIVFPLSIVLEKYIINNNKKYRLISLLLFLGLFAGGNRACMLSAIAILVTIYFIKLYKEKRILLLAFYIICFFIITCIILIFLLSDSREESNMIKYGHLYSYLKLFSDKPIYLLFGQGAGSLFYSLGTQKMTVQTEWTYIELIRYFGFIGSVVIIMIFSYPIFKIIKNRSSYQNNGFPVIISYVFYLLLAGTNPLLLSSTGFLACMYNYSFIYYGRRK